MLGGKNTRTRARTHTHTHTAHAPSDSNFLLRIGFNYECYWIEKEYDYTRVKYTLFTPGVLLNSVGVSTSTKSQCLHKYSLILIKILERRRRLCCISGKRRSRYRYFSRSCSLAWKGFKQLKNLATISTQRHLNQTPMYQHNKITNKERKLIFFRFLIPVVFYANEVGWVHQNTNVVGLYLLV